MPRTARRAPGNVVYHVLNRGNARQQIFDDADDYAAFERVIAETLAAVPMRLLSYCLMPNHWHLVLFPRRSGDLGAFMQRLTVTHVRRWHEHRQSVGLGHLYQGTYKSFPVATDEHFLRLCRYVECNAVRAGLAPRAQDWRWSSVWRREHGGAKAQALLTDWPVERPRQWLRKLAAAQKAAELQELRACVVRGRPYGSAAWQKATAARLGLTHTFRPRGRPKKETPAQ